MPTLTELQRQRSNFAIRKELQVYGEEVIADWRGSLSPSQLVDRKLEARTASDESPSRSRANRPRAK